jgi:hypothetical protein
MDTMEKLKAILKEYDKRYDSELCLLGEVCHQRGYHTNIKNGTWVHSAERSLMYAIALLDTGNYETPPKIIDSAIALQETDGDYAGVWPYFFEEPVSQMSPPDRNSADFCSKMLLQAMIDYAHIFSDEQRMRITSAIKNGCRAIMRRDVEIQYTNVTIMDAFVTVVSGELLNEKTFFEYGKNKLKRFWAYTQTMGALNEFNSPNYNLLIARDIALFMKQVKSKAILSLLEEINDFVWKSIAEHFFVPLKEWSAPNSRRYEDFLTDSQLYEIGAAAGVQLGGTEDVGLLALRNNAVCPKKYRKYFTNPEEKYIRRINSYGYMYPYFAFSQVNTTYMTNKYVLGSYNRSEMWNQIRPLQMFFGEEKKSLRLRVLHDGYDFSSGLLHCVQHRNKILGAVSFSTDRGDTHVCIDTLKDGRFSAEKLSVTFEITGTVNHTLNEHKLFIYDNTCNILIDAFAGGFDGCTVENELTETQGGLSFSLVLYSGKRREFSLKEINEAFGAFYMEVYDENPSDYHTDYIQKNSWMTAKIRTEGHELKIENTVKPDLFSISAMLDKQYIDGKILEDLCTE